MENMWTAPMNTFSHNGLRYRKIIRCMSIPLWQHMWGITVASLRHTAWRHAPSVRFTLRRPVSFSPIQHGVVTLPWCHKLGSEESRLLWKKRHCQIEVNFMFCIYTAVPFNMFKQNGMQCDLKKDYLYANKCITLLLISRTSQKQLLNVLRNIQWFVRFKCATIQPLFF